MWNDRGDENPMPSLDQLLEVLTWRRDVRRFRPDPVDAALLSRLLAAMQLAPSVGYSQPWRIVLVESAERRTQLHALHQAENALAADCNIQW